MFISERSPKVRMERGEDESERNWIINLDIKAKCKLVT